MKARTIIKALMLFIMVLPADAGAARLGELRLSLVEGDVQIKTEDTGEWVPAAINMPLGDRDRIWAPEGARTEVQAQNGTVIRLDENSSLDILTAEDNSLQFYLGMGQAYLNFRSQGNSIVQLDTPVSSIRVYDGSKFGVVVLRNGDTEIPVFSGKVYAESRNGKTQVSAGRMLLLGEDYSDLSPLRRPDSWEQWNKERDRRFEELGYSSRYLPNELEGYASDLDSNGKWVYTSPYGYVWTPTVYISLGWTPYRNGRWLWIGGDYVWIAYEPWGWVPYHYGRWSFIASYGWCWVPPARGDVYWGPGYVGWVYTPTYVSWVPLAPQEVYYGHGYYGRHSVNIVNVNISNIVVKEVYKNVYVNNAVTVVNNETFLRGKKADFKIRENPFLSERISVGRPRIEPERATSIPVIREIPKAKEPPGIVRDAEMRELKERRHFVRERDRSVFVPEASPKTMPVRRITEPKAGDAMRLREPEAKPGIRRIQPLETEQQNKTIPAKRKETPQAPAEKKVMQQGGTTVPEPSGLPTGQAGKRVYRQADQPVREQYNQPIQRKGETEKKQNEMSPPPAKWKETPQAPAEKKVMQQGGTTVPEPSGKRVYRQTDQPVTGKPSQQPDAGAVPETGKKEEKQGRLKPGQTQEEGVQEYKAPDGQIRREREKK